VARDLLIATNAEGSDGETSCEKGQNSADIIYDSNIKTKKEKRLAKNVVEESKATKYAMRRAQ
jgi:hypothetical protein